MLNRQIYKGEFWVLTRDMSEAGVWWKGLGKELEVDIETLVDNN
ncbi:MAG TPA: hypothetical protein VD689_00660 [Nitrosopumilaceae archaeon]|nr:hypothetical protein [Nitrosopumilaceae archaeon]